MIKCVKICIAIVMFTSCDLDVNTSDPQASHSIFDSKRDNFFIMEASKVSIGDADIIDSVWEEEAWHYKIHNGQKIKEALKDRQIIVRLKKSDSQFKMADYFSKWQIEEKYHGALGSGNGVFILNYPDNLRSDSLIFFLHDLKGSTLKNIGVFAFAYGNFGR